MALILKIPDDIARAAGELASASGSSPEEVLLQALQAHFPPVTPELQAELDAWNLASDEDMSRLEADLGEPNRAAR